MPECGYTMYQVLLPLAANTKVLADSVVCTDASGNIALASDTASQIFAGRSAQEVDNSAGTAAAKQAYITPIGLLSRYQQFTSSGAAQTNVGLMGFLTNAAGAAVTVGITGAASNKIAVGRIVQILSATSIVVDIWDRSALQSS